MAARASEKQAGNWQRVAAQARGGTHERSAGRSGIDMHHTSIEDVEALGEIGCRFDASADLVLFDAVHVFARVIDHLLGYAFSNRIPALARIDWHRDRIQVCDVLA